MITIRNFLLQTLLLTFLVGIPFSVLAQEGDLALKCEGPYKTNRAPSQNDLSRILGAHEKWVKSAGKEGARANLCEANLIGAQLQRANLFKAQLQWANLRKANLQEAYLLEADLLGANLDEADLRGANLQGAQLQGAHLIMAQLQKARLDHARLQMALLGFAQMQGAFLYQAELQRAMLGHVQLQGAFLIDTHLQGAFLGQANLAGADISELDLTGVVLDLAPGGIPLIPSFALATNLDQLAYTDPPHTLMELRNGFKNAGMVEQERILTFILNHGTMEKSWNEGLLGRLRYLLSFVFFDWTCEWGRKPTRPLLLLVQLIFPLAILYMFAATRKKGKGRIWKIWDPDRAGQATGDTTERYPLSLGWRWAIVVGIYFSLLSAFRIGWRDLNVGTWISRLQPNEYNLRATGWVRVVSGLQSIISVYLLALWALTTFGRPFE